MWSLTSNLHLYLLRTFLSSDNPILSCDGYQDIIDLFTGFIRGKLNVLLALGTPGQIETLRKSREFVDSDVINEMQRHQDDVIDKEEKMNDYYIRVEIDQLKDFIPNNQVLKMLIFWSLIESSSSDLWRNWLLHQISFPVVNSATWWWSYRSVDLPNLHLFISKIF